MKKIIFLTLVVSMFLGSVSVYAEYNNSPEHGQEYTEIMDFKDAQKEYYPSSFADMSVEYAKKLNIVPNTQSQSYLRYITREEFSKVVMDTYAFISNNSSVKNITQAEKDEIKKQYSDLDGVSDDVYNVIKHGFLSSTANDTIGLKTFSRNDIVTKNQLKVVYARMLVKLDFSIQVADSLSEKVKDAIMVQPVYSINLPAISVESTGSNFTENLWVEEDIILAEDILLEEDVWLYFSSNEENNKGRYGELAEPFMSIYGYGNASSNKSQNLNYEESVYASSLLIEELSKNYPYKIKLELIPSYEEIVTDKGQSFYEDTDSGEDFAIYAKKGVVYSVYLDDVGQTGTYGSKQVLQYKVPETSNSEYTKVIIKNTDTVKRSRTYRVTGESEDNIVYMSKKVEFKDEVGEIETVGKETVSVKVWDIDKEGNKVTKTKNITVNKDLASAVVLIFDEIYNGEEKFPIKELEGYSDRAGAHGQGMGIDINPTENFFIKMDDKVIAGSFYSPYENPYSITPDGDVVKAFAKYGWYWGGFGWSTTGNDFMHFSYSGV